MSKRLQLSDVFGGSKVLVTGHSGFKGAWLCAILQELGANVYGYSIDEPGDIRHIYHALDIRSKLQNEKSSIGDVRDLNNLRREILDADPAFIFHLAAQAIVSVSYRDPHRTFTSNIVGILNFLEVLRTENLPATSVLITSDKCYKNKEQVEAYREQDEMGGDDPYSASKGAAELLFHSYQKSYPQLGALYGLATARAGNVFGGGDWSPDRLIPDCARQSLAGLDTEIRMPNAVRPWTFVVDILWGYLTLAAELRSRPGELRGSWNFASGETKTVAEVVEKFIRSIGCGRMKVNASATVGKESSLLLIDPTKAERLIGWTPKFNVEAAIEHTAHWYKLQSEKSDIKQHTSNFLSKWYLDK